MIQVHQKARAVVVKLLKENPEWRCFFKSCCETGSLRLRAQSFQFRDELAERGQRFRLEEVEDVVLTLAREKLPDTPAAEWAQELCKDAMTRLGEHYAGLAAADRDALDLSGLDIWDERMYAAGVCNDPAAFRVALKGWERAGLETLDKVRRVA